MVSFWRLEFVLGGQMNTHKTKMWTPRRDLIFIWLLFRVVEPRQSTVGPRFGVRLDKKFGWTRQDIHKTNENQRLGLKHRYQVASQANCVAAGWALQDKVTDGCRH